MRRLTSGWRFTVDNQTVTDAATTATPVWRQESISATAVRIQSTVRQLAGESPRLQKKSGMKLQHVELTSINDKLLLPWLDLQTRFRRKRKY